MGQMLPMSLHTKYTLHLHFYAW